MKDTGDITTVRSELGKPIHKVNNRALELWREYDDTVFKLPREKRGAWFQEHRHEETVLRSVGLKYAMHEDHWYDLSMRNLTGG